MYATTFPSAANREELLFYQCRHGSRKRAHKRWVKVESPQTFAELVRNTTTERPCNPPTFKYPWRFLLFLANGRMASMRGMCFITIHLLLTIPSLGGSWNISYFYTKFLSVGSSSEIFASYKRKQVSDTTIL